MDTHKNFVYHMLSGARCGVCNEVHGPPAARAGPWSGPVVPAPGFDGALCLLDSQRCKQWVFWFDARTFGFEPCVCFFFWRLSGVAGALQDPFVETEIAPNWSHTLDQSLDLTVRTNQVLVLNRGRTSFILFSDTISLRVLL